MFRPIYPVLILHRSFNHKIFLIDVWNEVAVRDLSMATPTLIELRYRLPDGNDIGQTSIKEYVICWVLKGNLKSRKADAVFVSSCCALFKLFVAGNKIPPCDFQCIWK